MNIDEYERSYFGQYQSFAETVRHLLESAVGAAGDLPRPQSIQARAKTPASLRKRLEETGNLGAADVASIRRDLAGVRLIFYTNNDVNRFTGSSVVFDNFDVDRRATKVHHPVQENGEVRYQAIHYTVSLNAARAELPEYRMFAGMRCEIQIQTILIHAWAETSHDIVYKADNREGFGNEALQQIRKRFNLIMDKYLVPAGYEFQRVQQDYERLVAGKQLFDQDVLESLKTAKDNNRRYELVQSLSDDLLPLYDDITSIFPEILDVLVDATEEARTTPTKALETPFASIEGYDSQQIIDKVIDLIDQYKYAAVENSFLALKRIFPRETDERRRTRIVEIVGRLAGYHIEAWEQVGPGIQYRLADVVGEPNAVATDVRPLVVEVWKSLLDGEATSTTWSADAVSLNSGEVPVAQVRELRHRALSALFILFDSAENDHDRREVFHALQNATRSGRNGPGAEFVRESLADNLRIVEFFADRADGLSYELRETVEHAALYDFYRASELLAAATDPFECRIQATALKSAILVLRDRFNADQTYERYKVLVGFEGVMPWQWDDREYDHERVETYRDEQMELMLAEAGPKTQTGWLAFLERCAATRSNDGATFPRLVAFLDRLSQRSPSTSGFMLDNCNSDLLRFLAPFLNGLVKADDQTVYRRILERFLSERGQLWSIAAHWSSSKPDDIDTLMRLLHRAIEDDDRAAVAECMLFAMRNFPVGTPSLDEFFRPAIRHLISASDPRWVRISFMPHTTRFFEELGRGDAELILDSLLEFPEVTSDVDRVLSYVGETHLDCVWDYLGRRLDHPKEGIEGTRYKAAPHRFHRLVVTLSSDAALAVAKVRAWFDKTSTLFSYYGGRVLTAVFPQMTEAFAATLLSEVAKGRPEDAKFVVAVMQNYRGEAETHGILKELLRKFPEDEDVKDGVARSIRNTGVVHGEFGFVENIRDKKALLEPWLEEDETVAQFARQQVAEMDREILSEKRRADARKALREIEYTDEGED
ncbi:MULTISPECIES: GTP pyrophosphokinase [Rhizobium]|uniref:RelA/SpoT domain-containing protein n=1 Tax=Rhizobium phaseoli TaxID=396 RepID=A0A7X6F570_9HYPH|nr:MULTISPECIES: RelA/SpoT domain-containing protein [Rhizobium]MDE8761964.1 RelA/SpoT domain-containing protein [Rhizobium sp. CBK13]NKF13519.1 RelA/SpoT domain-containing protein [Rhizobium phaseoli]QPK10934.1 RelA/SpoT domain-containing protein [Rhizobium phaseoli]